MPSKAQLRYSVRKKLLDPQWRNYAFGALDVLERGNPYLVVNFNSGEEINVPFLDLYCQNYRSDLIHLEDKIITALAWQDILSGQLIYSFLQVRESPHPDRAIDANKAILKDMVEHYRERFNMLGADFWGGNQGADGYIEFAEPFIRDFAGIAIDPPDDSASLSVTPVDGQRTWFPLEVGYCMPDQMEFHLATSRCVARFPYNSDIIVFLESRRPPPNFALKLLSHPS